MTATHGVVHNDLGGFFPTGTMSKALGSTDAWLLWDENWGMTRTTGLFKDLCVFQHQDDSKPCTLITLNLSTCNTVIAPLGLFLTCFHSFTSRRGTLLFPKTKPVTPAPWQGLFHGCKGLLLLQLLQAPATLCSTAVVSSPPDPEGAT